MVEKLKKYNVCLVSDGFSDYVMESEESSDGEFFKVDDVEPILNSLQQLKAEILPHLTKVQSMLLASSTDTVEMLNQLRAIEVKLSAV